MTEEPRTWHYGVVARYWAEFNTEGPEIGYYREIIERYGQPALDAGCGTGRLLLPYLQAGLDVDGCDISPDMLALCREKAEGLGLRPRLYEQALHELDLPRRYGTIYACGAFGLVGTHALAMEALRRIYQHLEPDGALAFEVDFPWGSENEWQYWLPDYRRRLPEEWSLPGNRNRASDGTEYELRSRVVDLDPLDQVLTRGMLASQWRGEELMAREEYILRECFYFRNELLMMLERAGFSDVATYGDYIEGEATAEGAGMIVVTRK
jgi:SAM-dependent methyltransferase